MFLSMLTYTFKKSILTCHIKFSYCRTQKKKIMTNYILHLGRVILNLALHIPVTKHHTSK